MSMYDRTLEMWRPTHLSDGQMGYVFQFVEYEGNAYVLVRGLDGVVVWRRRGVTIRNEEFELTCFKSMERFILHYHPDFWTLQLRAKALEKE